MAISAPQGVPRPTSGSKDSKDSKNSKDQNSGYHDRAVDEKVKKDEQDRLTQIRVYDEQIRAHKVAITAEETSRIRFAQDLARLQSQAKNPAASGALIQIQNLTRQTETQIAQYEIKAKQIEEEEARLARDAQTKAQLLEQKTQQSQEQSLNEKERQRTLVEKQKEEKKEAQLIAVLEEEIRKKTQELKEVEGAHDLLVKEIDEEKKKPKVSESTQTRDESELKKVIGTSSQKIAEKQKEKARLMSEIATLRQNLAMKKQEAERLAKDSHEKEMEALLEKMTVADRRVADGKQRIKELEKLILDLKNKR